LSRYPEIGRRSGSRLDIAVAAGDYFRFEDTCPAASQDAKCHTYELVNYAPGSNLVVLKVGFFEWSRALLIDSESGRQFETDELPNISVDGRYLAVVIADPMSDTFNVEVIRHDREGFFLVGDKLDSEPCRFKEWRAGYAFAIVCKNPEGDYREERVSSQGGEKWSAASTGVAASEEEFEALDARAYEGN
jgi:hypothetical protein